MTRSYDGGHSWAPFEQITLGGYEMGQGDVYFFGVQTNPIHNGSLLVLFRGNRTRTRAFTTPCLLPTVRMAHLLMAHALGPRLQATFPLVHRMRGCIGLAASVDGVRWSRVTPLLSCSIYGERTLDQPAVPAMVRRGGEVWLYIHEEVPGITFDRAVPLILQPHLLDAEQPSRVVRYAFPCGLLARWTEGAISSLEASSSSRMRAGGRGVGRGSRAWAAGFADGCGAGREGTKEEELGTDGGRVGAKGKAVACEWKSRGPSSLRHHLHARDK